jgi:hypothetical protein
VYPLDLITLATNFVVRLIRTIGIKVATINRALLDNFFTGTFPEYLADIRLVSRIQVTESFFCHWFVLIRTVYLTQRESTSPRSRIIVAGSKSYRGAGFELARKPIKEFNGETIANEWTITIMPA